ncbi:MAG: 3-hydroxyacyl-CoA dehydrogenase, partial [Desulfuromonas sp.]
PNFVGNRIGLFALLRAMHGMDEHGLMIEEVDALCGKATCRPRSAVFRTADMVGIDTLVKVANHSFRALTGDEQRSTFELPGYLSTMVEKGLLGDKSESGFYRRLKGEGRAERQVLDCVSLNYRSPVKADFPCLAAARKIDDPGERLRTVLGCDDPGARFAWTTLRDTLLYAVNRIPEIAEGIEQVDRAMRWGFNWELGPFEMLEAIGVQRFIRRVEEDGVEVPAPLREIDQFYRIANGQKEALDPIPGAAYRRLPLAAGEIDLALLSSVSPPLATNREASLVDLGDGVFCLEFHSKMNSIGPDLLEMLLKAVRTTEEQGIALVIGNQGQVFSAGANLGVLAMALAAQKFDKVDQVVRLFQKASMALKYARIPVVAAPFNLTLGGACEFCLHADAIVAYAETYMGLVEVGVGILPAGGGCKELSLRAILEAERLGADVSPYLYQTFENIGMARVSTSAEELFGLGYLRHGDSITMSRARLLGDAKQKALALAVNYRPPIPRTDLKAPGHSLSASMSSRLWNLQQGGFISGYDRVIGNTIASVLCGGDVASGTPVSEERLLELEREGFLSLVGNPETAQRIEHMLKTGKPLRN